MKRLLIERCYFAAAGMGEGEVGRYLPIVGRGRECAAAFDEVEGPRDFPRDFYDEFLRRFSQCIPLYSFGMNYFENSPEVTNVIHT